MKKCHASCKFFRCARKSLDIRRTGKNVQYYCKWVGDLCEGGSCTYATCVKHALRSDGTCGLAEPRRKRPKRTVREREEKEEKVRLGTKALKKFKEYEKFIEEM